MAHAERCLGFWVSGIRRLDAILFCSNYWAPPRCQALRCDRGQKGAKAWALVFKFAWEWQTRSKWINCWIHKTGISAAEMTWARKWWAKESQRWEWVCLGKWGGQKKQQQQLPCEGDNWMKFWRRLEQALFVPLCLRLEMFIVPISNCPADDHSVSEMRKWY